MQRITNVKYHQSLSTQRDQINPIAIQKYFEEEKNAYNYDSCKYLQFLACLQHRSVNIAAKCQFTKMGNKLKCQSAALYYNYRKCHLALHFYQKMS